MSTALRLAFIALLALQARAEDWPQFRGVARDGIWHESGLMDSFPPQGLTVRWRKPVSLGWSGVVISQGRVFALDAELKKPNAKERLHCFDEATGDTLWTFAYDVKYPSWAFDGQGNGPTATPAVEGNRIWVLGINGEMHCLDTSTGAVLWKKLLNQEFTIADMVCRPSPLIEGDLLILLTGAKPGATVMALNKNSGDIVWKSLDEPVLNSSPIAITAGGKRQIIVWTGENVTALDPSSGATIWAERLITSSNDGTATPVFHDNRLLISGFMLEFTEGNATPVVLWPKDTKAVSKRVLSNTCTPLFRDEQVYSCLSRGQLACLDAATGRELWKTDNITASKNGAAINITAVDDKAYLFTDEGALILAHLNPTSYLEISRTQAIEPTFAFGGHKLVWTAPSYANGHIYLRNDLELLCLSLKRSP